MLDLRAGQAILPARPALTLACGCCGTSIELWDVSKPSEHQPPIETRAEWLYGDPPVCSTCRQAAIDAHNAAVRRAPRRFRGRGRDG